MFECGFATQMKDYYTVSDVRMVKINFINLEFSIDKNIAEKFNLMKIGAPCP